MSIRETIEWIEVTERLPDDDTTVLVCTDVEEEHDYPVWFGYFDESSEDGEWYAADGSLLSAVKRWAKMPTGEATP